ncbi:type I restriction-modification system restriction endonuclease DNA specificity subunit HsdS [Salinimicrobium marinum]|uniref:Type I restriction-modification system restriction endonuclease DNA specificity subunit HsdS n=1 Tax=Salinimicrobium marinum TaxID=680283 RepID=A0A918SE90_9FLAO|nr:restriction endonuclease subunit S [Salinimicrobium marinum]GHA38257.1 type I restriction-modification system restriction endonuclease DNA specificity subunit HsdS [Salinimicrobium marinum]
MKTLKVKNNWFNDSGQRLDASYYLSDGPLTNIKLQNSPYPLSHLSNETKDIFKGNIFRRVYVDYPHTGFPFMTSSDMLKSKLHNGKFVSKKYTDVANLMVDENWILTSRSGTLGNTIYTNKEFKNFLVTDDLIRIVPNNKKVKSGFLYAYLTSKYGKGLLTQSSYGGVVKHIEPHHIEKLLIPIFPIDFQKKIDQLISDSSNLRVQATDVLRKSHLMLSEGLKYKRGNNTRTTSLKTILSSHQSRLEASYYKSEGNQIHNFVRAKNHKKLIDISEEIYRPGIFKRHYVEKGVEFFGGAEIMKAIPQSEKKLSIAKTKHLESLKIEEDQILVTCGGTIGQTVLVNRFLAGKTASQHILRVKAKGIKTGYLFAFMSSDFGLKIMQSFTYGSVIPQIEPHHLELLPVPILEEIEMDKIHEKIMAYKENVSLSIEKELEAINLVEKEIEQWQK